MTDVERERYEAISALHNSQKPRDEWASWLRDQISTGGAVDESLGERWKPWDRSGALLAHS
jgi:hypothetical protein